jgi:hypothetical protein
MKPAALAVLALLVIAALGLAAALAGRVFASTLVPVPRREFPVARGCSPGDAPTPRQC